MFHSLNVILNNPLDYRECPYCHKINLKTNNNCVECKKPIKGVSVLGENGITAQGLKQIFSEEDKEKIVIEV